ncbi:hypothetical protein JW930_05700 [Candidatus Woesearchaeota archaeon]|nr:hypothetical protein [Candidatus Woesearchaeota archaeon]
MKKILLLCTIIVLFPLLVNGLGVVPSSEEILYKPGEQLEMQLKILNNNKRDFKVMLYAEGELSESIEFNQQLIEFTESIDSKIVSYTINMPEQLESKGPHEIRTVIREIPDEQDTKGTQVSASIAVVSKLIIFVPYEGKYAEAKLFVGNFDTGKSSNFVVEVNNLGEEDILEVKAIIDIYSPLNMKLATLKSDSKSVPSKNKELLSINWLPELEPGTYLAVATVLYDEKTTKDEKPFNIGTYMIDIVDISVSHFKLGSIAEFDILLENKWNQKMSGIYADVYVKGKNDKIYTKYTSSSVDIEPQAKQQIKAYWNTEKVNVGDYKLEIDLHYLDKVTKKLFDIYVSLDEIRTSLAGRVIESSDRIEDKMPRSILILSILVTVLVAINVYLIIKRNKK